MTAPRALVIGGRRGIGAAVVEKLAERGFAVTYTYRTDPGPFDASIVGHPLDLSDKAAVEAFALAQEDAPPWDALVQVGGTTHDSLAAMMDQAKAEAVMQVNYYAFARIARAVVRPMTRARYGRIVAIGSVIGQVASQGNAAYAASKAALLAYVRTLAIESARRGVTVNYVAPGFVDTEMTAVMGTEDRERIVKRSALRRLADPIDVARGVEFLLGDGGRNITGIVLTIDAGNTA